MWREVALQLWPADTVWAGSDRPSGDASNAGASTSIDAFSTVGISGVWFGDQEREPAPYPSYKALVKDGNSRNAVLSLDLTQHCHSSIKMSTADTNYNECKLIAFEWWQSPPSFRCVHRTHALLLPRQAMCRVRPIDL